MQLEENFPAIARVWKQLGLSAGTPLYDGIIRVANYTGYPIPIKRTDLVEPSMTHLEYWLRENYKNHGEP